MSDSCFLRGLFGLDEQINTELFNNDSAVPLLSSLCVLSLFAMVKRKRRLLFHPPTVMSGALGTATCGKSTRHQEWVRKTGCCLHKNSFSHTADLLKAHTITQSIVSLIWNTYFINCYQIRDKFSWKVADIQRRFYFEALSIALFAFLNVHHVFQSAIYSSSEVHQKREDPRSTLSIPLTYLLQIILSVT